MRQALRKCFPAGFGFCLTLMRFNTTRSDQTPPPGLPDLQPSASAKLLASLHNLIAKYPAGNEPFQHFKRFVEQAKNDSGLNEDAERVNVSHYSVLLSHAVREESWHRVAEIRKHMGEVGVTPDEKCCAMIMGSALRLGHWQDVIVEFNAVRLQFRKVTEQMLTLVMKAYAVGGPASNAEAALNAFRSYERVVTKPAALGILLVMLDVAGSYSSIVSLHRSMFLKVPYDEVILEVVATAANRLKRFDVAMELAHFCVDEEYMSEQLGAQPSTSPRILKGVRAKVFCSVMCLLAEAGRDKGVEALFEIGLENGLLTRIGYIAAMRAATRIGQRELGLRIVSSATAALGYVPGDICNCGLLLFEGATDSYGDDRGVEMQRELFEKSCELGFSRESDGVHWVLHSHRFNWQAAQRVYSSLKDPDALALCLMLSALLRAKKWKEVLTVLGSATHGASTSEPNKIHFAPNGSNPVLEASPQDEEGNSDDFAAEAPLCLTSLAFDMALVASQHQPSVLSALRSVAEQKKMSGSFARSASYIMGAATRLANWRTALSVIRDAQQAAKASASQFVELCLSAHDLSTSSVALIEEEFLTRLDPGWQGTYLAVTMAFLVHRLKTSDTAVNQQQSEENCQKLFKRAKECSLYPCPVVAELLVEITSFDAVCTEEALSSVGEWMVWVVEDQQSTLQFSDVGTTLLRHVINRCVSKSFFNVAARLLLQLRSSVGFESERCIVAAHAADSEEAMELLRPVLPWISARMRSEFPQLEQHILWAQEAVTKAKNVEMAHQLCAVIEVVADPHKRQPVLDVLWERCETGAEVHRLCAQQIFLNAEAMTPRLVCHWLRSLALKSDEQVAAYVAAFCSSDDKLYNVFVRGCVDADRAHVASNLCRTALCEGVKLTNEALAATLAYLIGEPNHFLSLAEMVLCHTNTFSCAQSIEILLTEAGKSRKILEPASWASCLWLVKNGEPLEGILNKSECFVTLLTGLLRVPHCERRETVLSLATELCRSHVEFAHLLFQQGEMKFIDREILFELGSSICGTTKLLGEAVEWSIALANEPKEACGMFMCYFEKQPKSFSQTKALNFLLRKWEREISMDVKCRRNVKELIFAVLVRIVHQDPTAIVLDCAASHHLLLKRMLHVSPPCVVAAVAERYPIPPRLFLRALFYWEEIGDWITAFHAAKVQFSALSSGSVSVATLGVGAGNIVSSQIDEVFREASMDGTVTSVEPLELENPQRFIVRFAEEGASFRASQRSHFDKKINVKKLVEFSDESRHASLWITMKPLGSLFPDCGKFQYFWCPDRKTVQVCFATWKAWERARSLVLSPSVFSKHHSTRNNASPVGEITQSFADAWWGKADPIVREKIVEIFENCKKVDLITPLIDEPSLRHVPQVSQQIDTLTKKKSSWKLCCEYVAGEMKAENAEQIIVDALNLLGATEAAQEVGMEEKRLVAAVFRNADGKFTDAQGLDALLALRGLPYSEIQPIIKFLNQFREPNWWRGGTENKIDTQEEACRVPDRIQRFVLTLEAKQLWGDIAVFLEKLLQDEIEPAHSAMCVYNLAIAAAKGQSGLPSAFWRCAALANISKETCEMMVQMHNDVRMVVNSEALRRRMQTSPKGQSDKILSRKALSVASLLQQGMSRGQLCAVPGVETLLNSKAFAFAFEEIKQIKTAIANGNHETLLKEFREAVAKNSAIRNECFAHMLLKARQLWQEPWEATFLLFKQAQELRVPFSQSTVPSLVADFLVREAPTLRQSREVVEIVCSSSSVSITKEMFAFTFLTHARLLGSLAEVVTAKDAVNLMKQVAGSGRKKPIAKQRFLLEVLRCCTENATAALEVYNTILDQNYQVVEGAYRFLSLLRCALICQNRNTQEDNDASELLRKTAMSDFTSNFSQLSLDGSGIVWASYLRLRPPEDEARSIFDKLRAAERLTELDEIRFEARYDYQRKQIRHNTN